MRLLFAGTNLPGVETLQRMFLIADEVAFMDRPAVTFGDRGFVGEESPMRRVEMPTDSPVTLSNYKPPWGSAERLYSRYIERDVTDPIFVSTFLKGLRERPLFAARYIGPEAVYSQGADGGVKTGREILSELLRDESLRSADLSGPVEGRSFETSTPEERRETLKNLLHMCSVEITATMAVSAKTDLLPVSDDRVLCQLLVARAADRKFVQSTPALTGTLALAIAQAVLPDQILRELEFKDILDYRKEAKDAYTAFSTEVDRLAVKLREADPSRLDDEIKSIVATDVAPRVVAYKAEMCLIRDRMFGSLMKKVAGYEFATLIAANWVGTSFRAALAAFAGAIVPALASEALDHIVGRRDVARKNAFAYLISAAPEI